MADIDPLRDLVISEIRSDFFKQLATRQSALYAEAKEVALRNPSWREPEGEMVEPHIRRALMEHELRLASVSWQLKHLDLRHAGDNCGYGCVRAGKLAITIHHVGGPNHFVRPCESRKQNAAVNGFLDCYRNDDMLCAPMPELETAGLVTAYILHGIIIEQRAGKEYVNTFLQLAFSDSELSRYVRNYSVTELLQHYASVENGRAVDIEDKVRPVINHKKKKDIIN